MPETTNEKKPTVPFKRIFTANFIGGIGWSLGITAGFALVTYLLSRFLNAVGGVPLIGQWFADIITTTQKSLTP